MDTYSFETIKVYPHHIKQQVCGSRARYRDGRKDRAVKVYTVNQESVYLMISNVPAVGGAENLREVCDQYGIVEDFRPLDDYPAEEHTEVYLVKYGAFPAARVAKKNLDDKSFLGGTLHVFYAPEFETIQETSIKLQDRRKYVAWKTNTGKKALEPTKSIAIQQQTLPLYNKPSSVDKPSTYVWAGKEYTVTQPSGTTVESPMAKKQKISGFFLPRQLQPTTEEQSGNPSFYLSQLVERLSQQTSLLPSTAAIGDPSYQRTISRVRMTVGKVSVPNMRVSHKRRKRV